MTNNEKTEGWSRTWSLLALIWVLLLCFVPDPRPLATPAWSIHLVKVALHVQEPAGRVIAAIALRMLLLGILGMLVMLAAGARRFRATTLVALVLAPLAGLITLWVTHRYFPPPAQLKLAIVATVAGALTTLLLRRNWLAGLGLVAILGITYSTLTNYSVSDDLAKATRAHVTLLFQIAPTVPKGDEAFMQLTTGAFALAAQRSRSGDPVLENQAAVLALALVLGDEKLAQAADRYMDPANIPLCDTIRAHTTLHQRADWSCHFWVSAGLVVLSGEARAMNVGVLKEMKDANPGGSGFSFGDLTADAAGERFAMAATRDVPSAVAMQERMRGPLVPADLMPDPGDLPEGIYADEFQQRYGGLGGARTDSLVNVIVQRLERCTALQ